MRLPYLPVVVRESGFHKEIDHPFSAVFFGVVFNGLSQAARCRAFHFLDDLLKRHAPRADNQMNVARHDAPAVNLEVFFPLVLPPGGQRARIGA